MLVNFQLLSLIAAMINLQKEKLYSGSFQEQRALLDFVLSSGQDIREGSTWQEGTCFMEAGEREREIGRDFL